MTKIAFQNGKVLARNDLVRITENGNKCCCNCPRCMRNGEWDCQYTTQESCEQCVRTYQCREFLRTQCDGTCPAGTEDLSQFFNIIVVVSHSQLSGGKAYGRLVIGCGVILSVQMFPFGAGSGFAQAGPPLVVDNPTVSLALNGGATPYTGPGSGAVLSPVIDSTVGSPTFGQITGVTVSSGGSGYGYATCRRYRSVAGCSECPPLAAPETAECQVTSQTGVCGSWETRHVCVDLPCCDSCRPECVPTLNVSETSGGYIKTSGISGPPPSWYGDIPWNEEWIAQYGDCPLLFAWVQDYVSQTDATGKYCGLALQYRAWGSNDYPPPNFQPPQGCEVQGWGWVYCHVYSKRYWVRYRLFLVNCYDRTISEVTEDALSAPIQWEGCAVPVERFDCDPGIGGASLGCQRPACDVANACDGANPGFLSASPTLECQ